MVKEGYRKLTSKEIIELRIMFREKIPPKLIALRLGITVDAVYKRIRKIK